MRERKDDLIGRILATERMPTTIDKFCFWTDQSRKLNAFDIVKVKHLDGSYTYGSIENISHITDASTMLTNFISSDFGDVEIDAPTFRVGMNYVEAKVTYNDKNIYTPVLNNAQVYLASAEEIVFALGLANVDNPLVCGSLKMYEGTEEELCLPVNLNAAFLIGPEGAHLNISGISGLAAKTSYAMFLMKALQERNQKKEHQDEESIAFVIFNVKGKDLMAIDKANDFGGNEAVREETLNSYKQIGLTGEPFTNVKYFIPYSASTTSKKSTYLNKEEIENGLKYKDIFQYKYIYEDDKESIEMMFSSIDDPNQTIESIISKIIDPSDADFGNLETWNQCMDKVSELSKKGGGSKSNDISVLSWRKFKRIFRKAVSDDMFANRVDGKDAESQLSG